ncbi:serine/threonine protein kinase [Ectopseudomonas guguanensis]|uniref:serine/threonine protein kinase n=1 Tax=Ectopseudomonas guguanensis TaxID=1198456 RepID=UPI0039C42522
MRYIRQIGRGGFGNVDLVQDESGRQFARKTFCINQGGNFPADMVQNVQRRFIREADTQSQFSHRNIMPVVFTDLQSDPPSFYMPVATASMADDIAFDRGLGGDQINAIMDILAGLEELHGLGIYHRDLKPQNVLRLSDSEGERYVISDFGLMSLRDTQLSVLTQTGMRMGSDYYTAPEIVADLRMASARSDIYSVGCILHDLFGTNNRIPCNEIIDQGFYADIMHCCTRTDPGRRFATVSDLREALLSLGQSTVANEPQVTDLMALLSSEHPITAPVWERIVGKVRSLYPSQDGKLLLGAMSLNRINEIVANYPTLASQLGWVYAAWVKDSAFNFDNCDGIANRAEAFLALNDINCKVEILIALLIMGTSHNRWYVERKFVSHCLPGMQQDLARRMAMEIRVMRGEACSAINHLERSIGFTRSDLHPLIVDALRQVCRS